MNAIISTAKMNIGFTLVLLFLLCNNYIHAQNTFSLSVTVVNENNDPLKETEMQLIDSKDSVVEVVVADNGHFEKTGLAQGIYTLIVFTAGYEEGMFAIELNENKNLSYTLKKESTDLEGVTVTHKRKIFDMKNGNMVVNVENSILSKMPDLVDILSKIPRVQLSADKEAISVIGKGEPLIYVGNQKVDLAYLKTIAVNDIKNIEVINNPSSKFEAEGRAVILITLKFARKEGYQIDITDTYMKKRQHNNYLGVNASFKRKRFELKTNLNYNALNPWEANGNEMTILEKNVVSLYDATAFTNRPQLIGGLGLYFQLDTTSYLAMNVNGVLQTDTDKNNTTTDFHDNGTHDLIYTLNKNVEDRNTFNSFLNYGKTFKKNAQIFTGFQFIEYDQNGTSTIFNGVNTPDLSEDQIRKQHFNIDVFSGRVDFEKLIKEKVKFEIGGLYKEAKAETNFNINDVVLNTSTASTYEYDEKNIAGYTQISGAIKNVNYFLGLRSENTIIQGGYTDQSTLAIDKNYINFFPKAILDIPIDSANLLTLSYAKSIIRPNYSSTSQVSVYINPYLIFSRNLNLNPTYLDELSANFMLKDKSFLLRFYQTKNPVYNSFEVDPTTNILTFKPTNFKKESGFNFDITLPLYHKIWNSVTVLSTTLNKVEDASAVFSKPQPYLYYYTNHNLSLPKGFTLSATVWGLTHRKEGVFVRNGLCIVEFAINKKFFDKIDVTIGANDLFRKLNITEDFTINNIATKGRYYTDTQAFYITLKYGIGVLKNSNYKEKQVDTDGNRVR